MRKSEPGWKKKKKNPKPGHDDGGSGVVVVWWGGGVSELYFYSALHFSTQKTAQWPADPGHR